MHDAMRCDAYPLLLPSSTRFRDLETPRVRTGGRSGVDHPTGFNYYVDGDFGLKTGRPHRHVEQCGGFGGFGAHSVRIPGRKK